MVGAAGAASRSRSSRTRCWRPPSSCCSRSRPSRPSGWGGQPSAVSWPRRGHGAGRRRGVRIGLSRLSVALGGLSPDDLLRPTIKFLGENDKNAAPYRHPVGSWLLHEPRVWAPVLVSFALVVVLRGRLLAADLAARVAQFGVAYTAFFWLYRFAVTSSVVETWWAYSFVVVAAGPAVGVLLHEVAAATDRGLRSPQPWRRRSWPRSCRSATIAGGRGPRLLVRVHHTEVMLALLGIGALAAVLMNASRRVVALVAATGRSRGRSGPPVCPVCARRTRRHGHLRAKRRPRMAGLRGREGVHRDLARRGPSGRVGCTSGTAAPWADQRGLD